MRESGHLHRVTAALLTDLFTRSVTVELLLYRADELVEVLLVSVEGRGRGFHGAIAGDLCLRPSTQRTERSRHPNWVIKLVKHRPSQNQRCRALSTVDHSKYYPGADVCFVCRVSLYLDPQIRDWVLFPITLVMVSRQQRYPGRDLSLKFPDPCWYTTTLRCRFAPIVSTKNVAGCHP
jgi:hypothetical protein